MGVKGEEGRGAVQELCVYATGAKKGWLVISPKMVLPSCHYPLSPFGAGSIFILFGALGEHPAEMRSASRTLFCQVENNVSRSNNVTLSLSCHRRHMWKEVTGYAAGRQNDR